MYAPINVKKEYRDKLKVYAAKQKQPIIQVVQDWIESLETTPEEPRKNGKTQAQTP